jgi:hypothetical protein
MFYCLSVYVESLTGGDLTEGLYLERALFFESWLVV